MICIGYHSCTIGRPAGRQERATESSLAASSCRGRHLNGKQFITLGRSGRGAARFHCLESFVAQSVGERHTTPPDGRADLRPFSAAAAAAAAAAIIIIIISLMACACARASRRRRRASA